MTSNTTPNPGDGDAQTASAKPLGLDHARIHVDGKAFVGRVTGAESDLHELPFVTHDADNKVTSYWRRSEPEGEDDGAIGQTWAWWTIWYLRKHGLDGSNLLPDIFGELVKNGSVDTREIAFVGVLGEYIATGRADLVPDVVAMHNDDVPPITRHAGVPEPDPVLPRVADFWKAHQEKQATWKAWKTRRAEVEAMPDCPPKAVPAFDKAGSDRWDAFMEDKGVFRLFDIANDANRRSGAAANAVFATPAQTIQGAIEKVKIARLVTDLTEGAETGDADLAAFQENEAPWIDNAIADLERLA